MFHGPVLCIIKKFTLNFSTITKSKNLNIYSLIAWEPKKVVQVTYSVELIKVELKCIRCYIDIRKIFCESVITSKCHMRTLVLAVNTNAGNHRQINFCSLKPTLLYLLLSYRYICNILLSRNWSPPLKCHRP